MARSILGDFLGIYLKIHRKNNTPLNSDGTLGIQMKHWKIFAPTKRTETDLLSQYLDR